jgi:hypothetical protein
LGYCLSPRHYGHADQPHADQPHAYSFQYLVDATSRIYIFFFHIIGVKTDLFPSIRLGLLGSLEVNVFSLFSDILRLIMIVSNP